MVDSKLLLPDPTSPMMHVNSPFFIFISMFFKVTKSSKVFSLLFSDSELGVPKTFSFVTGGVFNNGSIADWLSTSSLSRICVLSLMLSSTRISSSSCLSFFDFFDFFSSLAFLDFLSAFSFSSSSLTPQLKLLFFI